MAGVLSLVSFTPHLRTRFQVADAECYWLELVEAKDLSNATLEQFSLIFIGIGSPWLPQRLYKLTHPQMGEIELFLTPLGPEATGMRYEAAFSRFQPK